MSKKEMFGWEMDKDVDGFLVVADMLEKDGQQSRSEVVRYLVERVKLAEKQKVITDDEVLVDKDDWNEAIASLRQYTKVLYHYQKDLP